MVLVGLHEKGREEMRELLHQLGFLHLAQLIGSHHGEADVLQDLLQVRLNVAHAGRMIGRLQPLDHRPPQLVLVLYGQIRALEELHELLLVEIHPLLLPLGGERDVVHLLGEGADAGLDELLVVAFGGVLEPDMEDILELQFRYDVGAGEGDAHVTEILHVVLVGQHQNRQRVIRAQHDVAVVKELEKFWEDIQAFRLFH